MDNLVRTISVATFFSFVVPMLCIGQQSRIEFRLIDNLPGKNHANPSLGPNDLTYGIVALLCTGESNGLEESCIFATVANADQAPEFDGVASSVGLDLSELLAPGSGSSVLVNESLEVVASDSSQLRVSVEATGDFSLTPSGFQLGEPLDRFQLLIGAPGPSLPPVANAPAIVQSASFLLSDINGDLITTFNLPEVIFNNDTPDG